MGHRVALPFLHNGGEGGEMKMSGLSHSQALPLGILPSHSHFQGDLKTSSRPIWVL